MLETLESVDWSRLSHAYGPAVDVPDWLRTLATGDAEQRGQALYDLQSAVFHQGAWDESTPVVAPFLVEIVSDSAHPSSELLILLAAMSAAHGSDGYAGRDPRYVSSRPGPPDYPAARATVAGIEAGRSVFMARLRDRCERVRAAAAYVLGGLSRDDVTADALIRAFGEEQNPVAKASQALALGHLRRVPDTDPRDTVLVQGALAVARVWAAMSDSATGHVLFSQVRYAVLERSNYEALERLLSHAPVASFPWAAGQPGRLSARVLLQGAHDDEAFRARATLSFRDALRALLESGERIQPPVGASSHSSLVEPESAPIDERARPSHLSPLTPLSCGLGEMLFAATDGVLLPEQLTEMQRDVLALAMEFDLPMRTVGIPFRDPDHLRRYLVGSGPLGLPLTLGNRTAPRWCWLHEAHTAEDDQATAILDAVLALPAVELLDVFVAILRGHYPNPNAGNRCVGWKMLDVFREHLCAQAEMIEGAITNLAETLIDDPEPAELSQFVVDLILKGSAWPLDDRFIPVLARAVYSKLGYDIFEALPASQKLQVAATVGNSYTLRKFLPLVDVQALAPVFVANLLQPDWRFDASNTKECLKMLGEHVLDALSEVVVDASPRKKAFIEEYLKDVHGPEYELVVTQGTTGLEFSLSLGEEEPLSFTLPAVPKRADYAPIGEALMKHAARRVNIIITDENEREHLSYQISQALAAHVSHMSLVSGRSTLRVGGA